MAGTVPLDSARLTMAELLNPLDLEPITVHLWVQNNLWEPPALLPSHKPALALPVQEAPHGTFQGCMVQGLPISITCSSPVVRIACPALQAPFHQSLAAIPARPVPWGHGAPLLVPRHRPAGVPINAQQARMGPKPDAPRRHALARVNAPVATGATCWGLARSLWRVPTRAPRGPTLRMWALRPLQSAWAVLLARTLLEQGPAPVRRVAVGPT